MTNLVILFPAALPQLIMMVVLIAIVIVLLTVWCIFCMCQSSSAGGHMGGVGKPVKVTNT